MSYVIKTIGYLYNEGVEEIHDCFVCEDGSLSVFPKEAVKFENEAEAWDFAIASEHALEEETRVEEV